MLSGEDKIASVIPYELTCAWLDGCALLDALHVCMIPRLSRDVDASWMDIIHNDDCYAHFRRRPVTSGSTSAFSSLQRPTFLRNNDGEPLGIQDCSRLRLTLLLIICGEEPMEDSPFEPKTFC